jgi:large subunit ribosomal protein L4
MKGGGTVFGPRPRTYDFSLNKKVKTLAKYSALSHKAAKGSIMVVEDFTFEAPKTKQFIEVAQGLGFTKKTLVVLPDYDKNVYLSGRNLPDTSIVNVNDLNTYQLMNANKVVFLESSIAKVK